MDVSRYIYENAAEKSNSQKYLPRIISLYIPLKAYRIWGFI